MAFPQSGACGNRSLEPFHAMASSGKGLVGGDHRLEKLEFALAVAITRGDHHRVEVLREQIDALGGNFEEPGT